MEEQQVLYLGQKEDTCQLWPWWKIHRGFNGCKAENRTTVNSHHK